jgi:hypothetical protein
MENEEINETSAEMIQMIYLSTQLLRKQNVGYPRHTQPLEHY